MGIVKHADACTACDGNGLRGEAECASCAGTGYKLSCDGMDDTLLQQVLDKLDDILDKCNDIMEKLNE